MKNDQIFSFKLPCWPTCEMKCYCWLDTADRDSAEPDLQEIKDVEHLTCVIFTAVLIFTAEAEFKFTITDISANISLF